MELSSTVAHWVTRRKKLLFGITGLVVAASIAVIVLCGQLASDVLDLLPAHFDSVQTFKTFDREFSQARELTFAIVDEANPGNLDGFVDEFSEALRGQPWVVRVMDRSPMETPDGVQDVHTLAAPLLLNLEKDAFASVLQQLEPAQIEARLKKLRSAMDAGSPKAEFELEFDPLGIITPALKPLAGMASDTQARPLSSPDGTLRVVIATTNQQDPGAHACQAMMRQVEAFSQNITASWQAKNPGPAPRILVTGRTPYVGELSIKMRQDVVSTVASSAALVAIVFYLGFRRFRPLISIVHVLMLCCVVAVAAGVLVFHELNMITIGLCAILIGLGVDFGMVLYGIYEAERNAGHDHESAIASALRHHGSGIIVGALTTAAAFLSLTLSECTGFAQLGVLIAVGIVVAALLMMTLFFVFLGSPHRMPGSRITGTDRTDRTDGANEANGDWLVTGGGWFVTRTLASPRKVFIAGTAVLVLLSAYCASPFGRLQFDANPRSLEPHNSRAGAAMRMITTKMPAAAEPLIVLLATNDADAFHSQWNTLQAKWAPLVESGRIKRVATPAPFAVAPALARANAADLSVARITAAREAFTRLLGEQGLSADAFKPTFSLLDRLSTAAEGNLALLDWRKLLPAHSSWWFVLDRFLGRSANTGIAYVTPCKTLSGFTEKEELRQMLTVPGVAMHISGWTYTLADLVPWAKSKLFELTAVMIGFNTLILMLLYRRVFPLVILMLSLALSIGAMVATLKITGVALNLFNVLAFPLVLGVGVDYGIYVVIAMREQADARRSLTMLIKPVVLSALTTAAGFGSLATAENPALRGLGLVCAIGVVWCLFATLFFILPAYAWRNAKR